jgi:amino acid adenylation domain-containing protein
MRKLRVPQPKPVMEPFIFTASFAQQRLWFLEQFDPGKSVFHLLYAVRFDGRLNLSSLEQALNEVVRRHESLRTSFVTVDGQPMQAVARELVLEVPVIDLRTLGKLEAEAEARRWAQIEGERPFDLTSGPLLRATLIRISAEENVLVIAMHHIVSDGWSMGVFLRELASLYEAFCAGQPSPLPELPVQYADYSVWQREWMQGDVLAAQLSYWSQHLADAPPTLEIATDRPRPAIQTFAGARHYTEVPASLADRLRAFSRREGVTLFMTLLAVFDVLLWRYSGQDDVVIGTPIAGRARSELETLIGLFANTLPLRTSLAGNPTFRQLLQRVRETALGAYAHQDIPFDKLVEALQPERSLSHTPLFQVIFALENTPQALDHKGLALSWLEVERGTARTDLSLFMSDKGRELSAIWEYSSDLFDGETVSQMMSSYEALLESILEHPEEQIGYLRIWSEGERRQLVAQSDSVEIERTAALCMHQLFETQAEATPAATAVVFEDRSLTYQELNQKANQLAHHLQALGVRPEVPVGVCMERSAELIVALLGVLKAGGAYVPVDPAYPAERLAFMLEDSHVPVLLTQERLLESLPAVSAQIVCVDDWAQFGNQLANPLSEKAKANPSSRVRPENLAYVIYTSGSTGRPKGVQVRHETVVHLFAATRDQLGLREGDIWTVVHSSAFDFSVWEIWGSLLQGGALVVVPLEVVQSPTDFYDLLCRERVTILNQTPSALRELLRAREPALIANRDWSVRLIACGGDALDQELAVQLAQLGIPVWNFYGPTESTVWTTCGLIEDAARTSECDSSQLIQATGQPSEVGATLNFLGRPIRNLEVYLLDQQLQLVPCGVAAELFIGGAGLARGYLNRPELTAEKFIPNPFSQKVGERLYRTGDLARYRRQGKLEFLGRIDHQVKLRGFRVELGEIEVAISQHDDVAQAVALVREDRPGDKRLVAYVVAQAGRSITVSELRTFLQRYLPEYMVPSAFVMLEAMPLSANKKVDRKALPAPDYSAIQPGHFVAAQNPVEELVAATWAKLLGLEKVGIHDNFFELGGHSLLATQVISRIREAFQVELQLRALFETPTVAGLAQKLGEVMQAQEGLQASRLSPVARSSRLPLSFAQQRLWFLDQLEPGSPFYNIARAIRLQGPLDTVALSEALSEIVNRHESLRTTFGDDGSPFQRIAIANPLSVAVADLFPLPETERESKAEELIAEEIRQPFDLSRDTLLRAKLLRLKPDEHVLVITLHHIAADGWSLGVLFRELTVLYNAFAHEEPSPLPALPIQYADFAVWQRDWFQGDVLERLLSYWKKQLAGAPMVLELPADQPRPPMQSFRGAYELVTIPTELTAGLKQLTRSEGATLFMTCLAAFQLLLSRYTGQEDLIVGTDVANRNRVETEPLIGFFTNLLPLRTKLSGNPTFSELLRRVRETTLEAYAHEDLPFEKLVEELRPPRFLDRNPLVQVLLVMQNDGAPPFELQGLEISRFALPIEHSRFDLVVFLSESDDGLAGLWLYNPDLFESSSIGKMAVHFERLLRAIVSDASARLDSYEFLTEEETRQQKMEKKERDETLSSRLRATRRRGVDLAQMSGVRTEYLDPENRLPLVIKPDTDDIDLAAWANANREFIAKNLLQHGAILFRGFNVDSVPEFERFAAAICPELFGEYGDLPREELGGKVYGSTPYPADETILFHNESSHMQRWPMLIWFYCVKAAEQGGESPIIDCRRIYQLMEPRIRERFEQKGLMYVRNFTDELDVSWQSFFHTDDKSAVEEYCRQAGIDFEWKGDNGLRTREMCPAVVRHPQTGEMVFFNQVQLHHILCLAPAVRESLLSMMKEEDLPRNVYYGDGSRIEDSVMKYLGDLYRQTAVSFSWREHDVLMLNNMLVAHSRNPFVGERKIVVALGNLVSKLTTMNRRFV